MYMLVPEQLCAHLEPEKAVVFPNGHGRHAVDISSVW